MTTPSNCSSTQATLPRGAKPVQIQIDSLEEGDARKPKTGALVRSLRARITLEVAGLHLSLQIGLNLTVIGPRELLA